MPQPIYDLLGVALALLERNPDYKGAAKDYAGYSLEWLPLAANAQRQKASFTINSDVNFVAIYATWYATDTANPPAEVLVPMVTFNLSLADRQIFDKDTFLKAAFGSQVTNGFPLAFPLWLPGATTLNGFMTNLDTVNARTIRLTFHGFILHQGRSSGSNRAGGF